MLTESSKAEQAHQSIIDEFADSVGLSNDAPEKQKMMENVLNLVVESAKFDSQYAITISRIIAKGYPGTKLEEIAQDRLRELGSPMFPVSRRKSLREKSRLTY